MRGHLTVRGGSGAEFSQRCISPTGVAPPSNIPDILARRAWSAKRLVGLGVTRHFHHELLGQRVAPVGLLGIGRNTGKVTALSAPTSKVIPSETEVGASKPS